MLETEMIQMAENMIRSMWSTRKLLRRKVRKYPSLKCVYGDWIKQNEERIKEIIGEVRMIKG